MKKLALIILGGIVLILAVSEISGESSYENDVSAYNTFEDDYPENGGASNSSVRNGGELEWYPVHDAKAGMISSWMPLPSGWAINAKETKSPAGTKVFVGGFQSFNYGQVPDFRQYLQQGLRSQLQQHGYQMGEVVQLPGVAQADQNYNELLWNIEPTRTRCQAAGVSFRSGDGRDGFLIVHWIESMSANLHAAMTYFHRVEAGENNFGTDRDAIVFALANTRRNMDHVNAHNNSEMRLAGVRNQQFQTDQRSRDARFREGQRNLGQIYAETNDIIADGYKSRTRVSDQGQWNAVNGALEQETYYNPHTGTTENVDAGSQRTFFNYQGEVMQTDNQLYDPDVDVNANPQQWREGVR